MMQILSIPMLIIIILPFVQYAIKFRYLGVIRLDSNNGYEHNVHNRYNMNWNKI